MNSKSKNKNLSQIWTNPGNFFGEFVKVIFLEKTFSYFENF